MNTDLPSRRRMLQLSSAALAAATFSSTVRGEGEKAGGAGDAIRITRLKDAPIIAPEMLPGADGHNINGPALIRVPEWLPKPLGKYYLYFAHHGGTYIRLAYADRIEGPWKVHEPGTLRLADAPGCKGHIASPDIWVDNAMKQIRLYFHGPARSAEGQKSFVALSPDGLSFKASAEVLGIFYWRVFQLKAGGWFYAMAKGGLLYRSKDGLTNFEEGISPFPGSALRDPNYNGPGPRHVAVRIAGDRLQIYYSSIGDAPERIFRCEIDTAGDWKTWKTTEPKDVLKPETEWEGAKLPLKKSAAGAVKGRENALRDPAIFEEEGKVYLLYSVAGESGIGIARVEG